MTVCLLGLACLIATWCFADLSFADTLPFPEGILLMFKSLMPSLAFGLLLVCC